MSTLAKAANNSKRPINRCHALKHRLMLRYLVFLNWQSVHSSFKRLIIAEKVVSRSKNLVEPTSAAILKIMGWWRETWINLDSSSWGICLIQKNYHKTSQKTKQIQTTLRTILKMRKLRCKVEFTSWSWLRWSHFLRR